MVGVDDQHCFRGERGVARQSNVEESHIVESGVLKGDQKEVLQHF